MERKKNKELNEPMSNLKDEIMKSKEAENIIVDLTTQLDEARILEEVLTNRLEEKIKVSEKLEAESDMLRKELQKLQLGYQGKIDEKSKVSD